MRAAFSTENAQAIEFLHRRVDVEDVVTAHLLAVQKAPELGFGRYIISATTPFGKDDLVALRADAASVVRRYYDFDAIFARKGWSMYPSIDRVYVNHAAQEALG